MLSPLNSCLSSTPAHQFTLSPLLLVLQQPSLQGLILTISHTHCYVRSESMTTVLQGHPTVLRIWFCKVLPSQRHHGYQATYCCQMCQALFSLFLLMGALSLLPMWESPPERPPRFLHSTTAPWPSLQTDQLLRCPVPTFHRDCRCSTDAGVNTHTSSKSVHLCQAGNSFDHLHVWCVGIMLPWVVSLMLNICSTEAVETIHENTVSGQLNSF